MRSTQGIDFHEAAATGSMHHDIVQRLELHQFSVMARDHLQSSPVQEEAIEDREEEDACHVKYVMSFSEAATIDNDGGALRPVGEAAADGTLPAGEEEAAAGEEAAAAADGELAAGEEAATAADGALAAGEANIEKVGIDVKEEEEEEEDHDNNVEDGNIVLKQNGSDGEEAFSAHGNVQLGFTVDTPGDENGVDCHGGIKPIVLPENAQTSCKIELDGTMADLHFTDGIEPVQPMTSRRSRAIATTEIDQESKEAAAAAATLSTEAVNEPPAQGSLELLHFERPDDAAAGHPVINMGSGQPVSSAAEAESGKVSTLDEVLVATTCAGITEAMTRGAPQADVSRGSDKNLSEGLDVWGIKPRKWKRPLDSKLMPGQPDAAATTSKPLVDLPVASEATATRLINAGTKYGNSAAAVAAVREDLSGFQSTSRIVEDQLLHVDDDNADKQLEQAQTSAQEAMATAASALAQSQIVWACIHLHKPSDSGTARRREVQIASLAATMAAATSVAKAAIEAAGAIGQASNEAAAAAYLCRSDVIGSQKYGQSTKKRAMTEIHQNVEILQPMVRAAGLAVQAAAQAGALMATGIPLTQASSMANYWMRKVAELKGEANRKGKSGGHIHKKTKPAHKCRGVEEIFSRTGGPENQAACAGSSPPMKTPKKKKDKQVLHTRSPPPTTKTTPKKTDKKATPMTTTPRAKTDMKKASSKRGVFVKGKEVVQGHKAEDAGKSSSKHTSPSKRKKTTAISEMAPRHAALQLAGFATQRLDPRELVGCSNINVNPEVISEGSVVEVMSEEEGLRGGWFSAKVLMLTEKEALVVYDELLTDDGRSNLKEWFPQKDSFVGNGILRRMRPMHPFVFIKDKGSRIRRRVAMGSQAWSVGDHVDAFLQDGWWEGVVKEVNNMDENKITVYFPGEDDTAIVKTWNVRPSLTWKDGTWGPWTDTWNNEDVHQPAKLQKVESPSVKGKKTTKKRKLMELREDIVMVL